MVPSRLLRAKVLLDTFHSGVVPDGLRAKFCVRAPAHVHTLQDPVAPVSVRDDFMCSRSRFYRQNFLVQLLASPRRLASRPRRCKNAPKYPIFGTPGRSNRPCNNAWYPIPSATRELFQLGNASANSIRTSDTSHRRVRRRPEHARTRTTVASVYSRWACTH